jgi:hypothetical protein
MDSLSHFNLWGDETFWLEGLLLENKTSVVVDGQNGHVV